MQKIMNLEAIKECKNVDLIIRLNNAMVKNYFGGDTITFDNFDNIDGNLFSDKEIKYMMDSEVLEMLKTDGWNVTIIKPVLADSDFDFQFVCKSIK